MAAALLALSFVVYAPALSSEFVSDDRLAITGNEFVAEGASPLVIFSRFSWWGAARADAPGYRPLVTLSFALDRALAGLDAPGWFHTVNVVWHALVSWLVFLLGRRLLLMPRDAMFASVAFCLLPIHSEAVIWTVGRAELMAAAGFAGALCLLLDHRVRPSIAALLGACALFLGALFSKENAVTLLAAPVIAAVVLPGTSEQRKRDALALAALSATLALYLVVRAGAGPLVGQASGDLLDNPLSVLPTADRWLGAISVLGRYLALIVWPRPLSVDYSYDALGIGEGFRGDGYAVFALLALVALGYAAWRTRRQAPVFAFGFLLEAASYSIVSNTLFVVGTAMAERLFYLPTVGLCLAGAPLFTAVADAARGRGRIALAALAVAWGATVALRSLEWRTPVTLFEAAAREYPRSARAQMELATAYGQAGKTAEAEAAFRRATEIMPAYAAAWYNLGNLYARRARNDEAERAYRTTLSHAPRLVAARHNLGVLLLSMGRAPDAIEVLEGGLQGAKADPAYWMLAGDAYLAAGRNGDAAQAYGRVLDLVPEAQAARLNRGVALERTGGCETALPDYLAVVENAPSTTAVGNAVACLQRTGRMAEAAALLDRARVANRGGDR
jgi:tetratricopeptide (TPR) repeat protein